MISKSKNKFIIIVGGGKTARKYLDAAKKLGLKKNKDLDWIGIKVTRLNAQLIKEVLGSLF